MGATVGLYEQDFYAWTQQQVALLKAGKLGAVDVPHLIEEIESMGASERRELLSRLEVLMAHLLKWQYQPSRRSKSWRLTIREQRVRLSDHLSLNPSLSTAGTLAEHIDRAYKYALLAAQRQTGLPESTFTPKCPYTVAQLLDDSYYPDAD